MRFFDGNLRVLRARYLFALAATCNCPPPVVDQLTINDFARLVTGLDQMHDQK
jgi:hypothetical protein